MNLKQINDWREAHGLPALAAQDNRAQKRRQRDNAERRAQESRDLKAKRAKGGK